MNAEREPLLSDNEASDRCHKLWRSGFSDWQDPMEDTREFYEDKITNGELRRVEKVFLEVLYCGAVCSGCKYNLADMWPQYLSFKYCPSCGNPILK